MIRKYLEQALISSDLEDIKRNVLRAYEIVTKEIINVSADDVLRRIKEVYERDGIIAAIKLRRFITGEGLRDAKMWVDFESQKGNWFEN